MGLSSKQVSSDVEDWDQALLQSTSSSSGSSMELPKLPMKRQQQQDQQQPVLQLKCPRCDSTNTKFCYYNNYNKSQPRHFCKSCKRHWTNGGILRNVPVGGGRKKKRPKTSANAASASATKTAIGGKNSLAQMGSEAPQQRFSFPLALKDEKITRETLNQALLGPQSVPRDGLFKSTVDLCVDNNTSNARDISGIFGGSNALPLFQNHGLQFPCQSFSSLDDNFPSSISGSGYITNLYGYSSRQSNALEDTVMTSVDASLSCSALNDQPWTSVESTSNWDWDDVDKLITSDATIPWDDVEIN